MHRASKHIEIRYHFVREKVQDGSLKLVYIPSSENIADVLTKSTRKNTFVYLRDKFMHSPQRTPHEALIVRSALIAKLVQETVQMNEWEPKPRVSHRLRLMADPRNTADAEGDFLNAVETHMIGRESYVSWEGELIHCDEESDYD